MADTQKALSQRYVCLPLASCHSCPSLPEMEDTILSSTLSSNLTFGEKVNQSVWCETDTNRSYSQRSLRRKAE